MRSYNKISSFSSLSSSNTQVNSCHFFLKNKARSNTVDIKHLQNVHCKEWLELEKLLNKHFTCFSVPCSLFFLLSHHFFFLFKCFFFFLQQLNDVNKSNCSLLSLPSAAPGPAGLKTRELLLKKWIIDKATSPLKHPKIPHYAQFISLATEIFNINPQALIQIQTFAFLKI